MKHELENLRIDKSHKASRHSKPIWPWILIVLLLAGGGFAYWHFRQGHDVALVETVRVRVLEGSAAKNDLVLLNATGYIIAAHKIELASKVVGRVAWIGVEMGDKVQQDQVLVRLEDDEFKARVAQQLGQLNNAKARLAELEAGWRPEEVAQALSRYEGAKIESENAQRAYERLQTIKNTVTAAEMDDAESLMRSRQTQVAIAQQQYEMMKSGTRKEQLNAQRATVAQLQGTLDTTQVDLNNTVIRSPIAASVLERNVEVGEFITTGFVGDRGAKGYVVSIADLNDLLVELDISQDNFAKVSANQPCWITTDAYPDRKYNGIVERISPVANRQKATILVRVRVLKPDDYLKPDMNATVSFLSTQKIAATQESTTAAANEPPVIRIPAGAVRDGAVFVVENGKAVRRAVTAGLTAANGEIEIRKGLLGGEDMIVHPPESLHDGDGVQTAPANTLPKS